MSDDRSDRMQPPCSADTMSDGVAEPHVQPASIAKLIDAARAVVRFYDWDYDFGSEGGRNRIAELRDAIREAERNNTGPAPDTRDASAG